MFPENFLNVAGILSVSFVFCTNINGIRGISPPFLGETPNIGGLFRVETVMFLEIAAIYRGITVIVRNIRVVIVYSGCIQLYLIE